MALFSTAGGDRRRRVLTEQMIAAPATAGAVVAAENAAAGGEGSTAPSYSAQALSSQPGLTQLIARRYTTLALWFLLAALVVVGLESIYVHLPDLAARVPGVALAPLDLNAAGNLGDWYASLLLTWAAAGSLVIYAIRRHKVDDYRGRYRIWLWAACGWLVLSAAVTSKIHLLLPVAMIQLTGVTGWAEGAWWWVAPAVLIYGALGLRLAMEIRGCRLALAALTLAGVAWSVSLAAHFGQLPLPEGAAVLVVATAAALGANVLLLAALGLYARHVLLDASGELPVRAAKPARAAKAKKRQSKAADKKAAADEDEASATEEAPKKTAARAARNEKTPAKPAGRSDLDDDEPPATIKPSAATWTDEEDDEEEGDEAGDRKLSKAERRRLRKQSRQNAA